MILHSLDYVVSNLLASCLLGDIFTCQLNPFLANVNSSSCSLYVIVRPSVVCRLSVCNVGAPYKAIEIFRNVSTP